MTLTKNGVAYDLKTSPYILELKYECMDHVVKVTYIFSSELYMNKFEERLEDNREKISTSLTNRFGIIYENDVLCDINLYSKIEKRGFYLVVNGVSVECLNHIILDGKNPIIKS